MKKISVKELLEKYPELKKKEDVRRFGWYLLKTVDVKTINHEEKSGIEEEVVVLGYIRGGKYQVVSGSDHVNRHRKNYVPGVLAYVPIYHSNTKKKS